MKHVVYCIMNGELKIENAEFCFFNYCLISYAPSRHSFFMANSPFEKTKPILSFSVRRSDFSVKIRKCYLKKQSQC
jgi:hypothetical protein